MEAEEFYALHILTAAERIQPLIKKGEIEKDDVDGLINLMSDLKKIANEARIAGMARELDRADIVRDLMLGKVPFMADEFYKKEARKKRKEPTFRMKFQDVVDVVLERAQILKAQGKTSRPAQGAKVAAASTNIGSRDYSGVVRNSPPKIQPPLPAKVVCVICQFGHATETCEKLSRMTVEERLEEIRRRGLCFNCFSGRHISRRCDQQRAKCGSCEKPHHTLLHIEGWVPAARRVQVGGEKEGINTKNDDTNRVNGLSEESGGVASLALPAQSLTVETEGGEEVTEELEGAGDSNSK